MGCLGISKFVSIDALYGNDYRSLSKKSKLEFDLKLLKNSGFSGPTNITTSNYYEKRNGIYQSRKWFCDEIKKMILKEERKLKLNKINEN